ncbi:hypothetical protein [Streptomyces sp. NPDC005302]|uniref:hypothetical protein n=1 Tax=Streptomyces sp. NPDC005302 TaxID=3154675 RepID=UPI0033A149DC
MVRPVTQSILHGDPDGRPGNCLQAAVASLLELPLQAVPHFLLLDDWWGTVVDFCRLHGVDVHEQSPDEPCAYGMAFGFSERGVRHAVCWIDGRIAHDPHPSRRGLVTLTELIAFHPVQPRPTVARPQGQPPMSQDPPAQTEPAAEWPPPAPLLGQRVLYRLTRDDVRAIARQRLTSHTRAPGMRAGDVFPGVIVRVTDGALNAEPCSLQVFLDGPDAYWVQNVLRGKEPGTWTWSAWAGA